jgi:hypothetical protein
MRRTVIASLSVAWIVVVTVSISMIMIPGIILVVINRAAIVVVAAVVITKVHLTGPWHPASIYPTVTSPVVFPISRNPISIGIRS